MSGVSNGPLRLDVRHPDCPGPGTRARCSLWQCRFHLAVEVLGTRGSPLVALRTRKTGRVTISVESSLEAQLAFAEQVAAELPAMKHTCAIAFANEGEHTVAELAELEGVTERDMRRRIRAALIAYRVALRRADDNEGT